MQTVAAMRVQSLLNLNNGAILEMTMAAFAALDSAA